MAKTTKADAPVGEVHLKNVRLSFADIFRPGKPQKNEDGTVSPGKFHANFLMPKGTKQTEANRANIKAVADAVKKTKWANNQPKLKPDKVCLRDGDLEDWDGYADNFYLSSSNKRQPTLSGLNPKGPAVQESDGLLYAGCWVNAIVRLWCQDNEHGKRLNASLEAIQFVRHDDAFGAKPVNAEEAFEDLSGTEEEGEDTGDAEAASDDDSLI